MRPVLVVVLAACAGQTSSPRSPSQPPPGPPPRPAITAERFCLHFDKLSRTCPPLANARVETAACIAETRAGLESKDPHFAEIATCIFENDDCQTALACIAAHSADPTDAQALRACEDDSSSVTEHAVGIPRPEWDQRKGAGVTAFRDARSTKEAPIEMCGVAEANDWLVSLRCNDGSQPLKTRSDAEDFRAGNVGPGGRCHSIIDRYLILCPERRYEIFIDAYMCPRPD